MRIVPISKHEYKVFPIADEEPYIEITKEEYEGLELFEKCFSNDLTRVIDYVKSEEEIQEERIRQRNFDLIEQIGELKAKLGKSDYKALKYFEGERNGRGVCADKSRTTSMAIENQRIGISINGGVAMVASIIISVCASIISGMVLFFLQRFFKKKQKVDEERDRAKAKENMLILKSIDAVGKLTYADAVAIRDGKTNGEMKEAMKAYAEVKDELYEYLLEQNSKK